MKTSELRKFRDYSNKKLNRARRLYIYLCFESVIGDIPATVELAKRMQRYGLYSSNSASYSVCMGVLNHLGKLDIKTNPKVFKRRTSLWREGSVNSTNWLDDVYGIRSFCDCTKWFKKDANW